MHTSPSLWLMGAHLDHKRPSAATYHTPLCLLLLRAQWRTPLAATRAPQTAPTALNAAAFNKEATPPAAPLEMQLVRLPARTRAQRARTVPHSARRAACWLPHAAASAPARVTDATPPSRMRRHWPSLLLASATRCSVLTHAHARAGQAMRAHSASQAAFRRRRPRSKRALQVRTHKRALKLRCDATLCEALPRCACVSHHARARACACWQRQMQRHSPRPRPRPRLPR
jgi:hypothetical protein